LDEICDIRQDTHYVLVNILRRATGHFASSSLEPEVILIRKTIKRFFHDKDVNIFERFADIAE